MYPLAAHERRAGTLGYRLVVGPLPNSPAATGLCPILRPPAPPANPSNSTANRSWNADCRAGSGASAYCAHEIVPAERARDQLASDYRFFRAGYALYMRYLAVEQSPVGLACQAGLNTWLCVTRQITIALFTYSVFGWFALFVASAEFVAPSLMLFGVALAAACCGTRSVQYCVVRARRRTTGAQPRASRTRARLIASPARAAQVHSDCQLAKPSLGRCSTTTDRQHAREFPQRCASLLVGPPPTCASRKRNNRCSQRRKRKVAVPRIEDQAECHDKRKQEHSDRNCANRTRTGISRAFTLRTEQACEIRRGHAAHDCRAHCRRCGDGDCCKRHRSRPAADPQAFDRDIFNCPTEQGSASEGIHAHRQPYQERRVLCSNEIRCTKNDSGEY